MKADLVVFGEDWGGHPSSTQHLIRHMARERRVVWVNSIGLRRPRLSWKDIGRAFCKLGAALPGASAPAPEGIEVVAPFAIPWPGSSLAQAVNRKVLGWQLRSRLRKLGIERPILWASLPTAVAAVGELGERAVVYYCGDDFASLAGVDHKPVTKLEADLVRKANLVFAASEPLMNKFPEDKAILLPHGVDAAFFSASGRPADLPPGPLAGFYGSIEEWLDQDLLAETAALLPDWTFVLIGPIKVPVDRLARRPNIRFLGPRPHRMLPDYVRHWQASLIPFRLNLQVFACNPLKLREYMAAGTPIVSTDFPALEGYRDLIRVAGTPDQFAAAILAAESEGRERALDRAARVAPESWEARARQVSGLLDMLDFE